MVVRDANPFETVFLARGAPDGPGSCPPPLGGPCLDRTRPFVVGSVSADAEGTAVFTVPLPDGAVVGLTSGCRRVAMAVPGIGARPFRLALKRGEGRKRV